MAKFKVGDVIESKLKKGFIYKVKSTNSVKDSSITKKTYVLELLILPKGEFSIEHRRGPWRDYKECYCDWADENFELLPEFGRVLYGV